MDRWIDVFAKGRARKHNPISFVGAHAREFNTQLLCGCV